MSFTMFCILMGAVFGSHTDSARSNTTWCYIWTGLAVLSALLETLLRLLKP